MPNELRTLRRFYNREQYKMYYPGELCIVQSDVYAAKLVKDMVCERVSIRPGTPMRDQTVQVSTASQPVIETKVIQPNRVNRNKK